jgi:hypothetical protein
VRLNARIHDRPMSPRASSPASDASGLPAARTAGTLRVAFVPLHGDALSEPRRVEQALRTSLPPPTRPAAAPESVVGHRLTGLSHRPRHP